MRGSRILMAALFVVSAVVVVEAQQPGRGRGGFGGFSAINLVITNKALQTELKVTDTQKDKFKEVAEKQTELGKKAREAGRDKDKFAEIAKERTTLNDEIKKVVSDTLTPDQMKRLNQIDLQYKGMRAFSDEKVVKQLNLTEAQTAKIKGINEEYRNDSKGLGFGGFGKNQDKEKAAENQKKREKLTKAAMADIEDVLTADQRKQWKEMVGSPFDVAQLNQFGGNFGGNRGKGKRNKTKD
ncbi:MAG TPA: hypothetical protein VN641_07265 [Urbifossiella sp.]|nr:hypothetical protein [Urbifossiella sp.]